MTIPVSIVATGARTPLGLSAASAAAALRAGISRIAEHPFMVDQTGTPVRCVMDSKIDPARFGYQRCIELVKSALSQIAELRESPPLYLALPEFRPGFAEKDVKAISSVLPCREIHVTAEGHAAGFAAFQQAMEQIQSGRAEACLVAGVDSYFHPGTMDWLDRNRQIIGSVSRSGFVPGEGAAVCLLMSEAAASSFRMRPLGWVTAAVTERETRLIKTDAICLGEALTSVVRSVTAGLEIPAQAVTDIVCDLNGERYRGEEWGFACLRLPLHMANPTGYVSPADCWGDMGAASGPLFAMLACQAVARKYANGSRALLWASSEGGLRGALLLEFNHVV